jgi:hypothetical protein
METMETTEATADDPPGASKSRGAVNTDSDSESTIKDDDRTSEYDQNEIFFTQVTQTKRNRKNLPKQSNKQTHKKARKDKDYYKHYKH